MRVDGHAAFYAFRHAVDDDLVAPFLDFGSCPGQFRQVIGNTVAFLIPQVFHIIEA
ncbi:hypothetical protein D3C74_458520 [compost metagenome]